MQSSNKTKSRTYIVPLIHDYVEIHKSLMVNSYLFDLQRPEYNVDKNQGLFVLFRWSDNEVYKLYEDTLLNSPYLVEHYDVDTEHYMLFLKYPADVLVDVDLILEGKYSKISEKSKRAIIKYWNAHSSTDVYGTLFRTAIRKQKLEDMIGSTLPEDAEYSSIINLHHETFQGSKQLI